MPNAAKLPHQLDRSTMSCRVVIETPRGSRSKFNHDAESGLFRLASVAPGNMRFPFDFGFVPSTLADDGDPLDAMVLHDEPLPTGALVTARLIGVIEGEETIGAETFRNDRLLAVTDCGRDHGEIREVEQLGSAAIERLCEFWVTYNALRGRTFVVLGVFGPAKSAAAVELASVPEL